MVNRYFLKKGKTATAGIFALVLAVTVPAYAGFEWTPPANKPAMVPVVPPTMTMEMHKTGAPGSQPRIDPYAHPEITSEPMMPGAAAPSVIPVLKENPFAQNPADMAEAAPAAPAVPAVPVYEEAVGFGTDIPLVMAMRQIVPPRFSYAFDPNIDPALRVSWSGGKPWDEVLSDAVRPQDMEVVISDNSVWIRKREPETVPVMMDNPLVVTDSVPPMMMPPAGHPVAMPQLTPDMPAPPLVNEAFAYEPVMADADPMNVPVIMAEDTPMMMDAAEQDDAVQSYPRRQRPEPLFPQGPEQPEEVSEFDDPADLAVMMDAPAPPPLAAPPSLPPGMMKAPAKEMPGGPVALPLAMTPSMAPATDSAAARGPVLDPLEIRFWQAEKGTGLKSVLSRWANEANVAMLWNSAYDYELPEAVKMHGTFPDVVTNILMRYNDSDPRPLGRLHPNLPGGPSVLVIENYSLSTQ
ncbi:MAG: TcpQ domain-containing protein [Rhodospirillales bacterium]|nr:TcpQ domain-containing protein [Rhodospirillales bacterium]MCB9996970.1 TcpQ domain-containing protein [Rhodospirillales bacterium]